MAHYFEITESALAAVDYNRVNLLSGSSNKLKH
jgi:hypothetical protein